MLWEDYIVGTWVLSVGTESSSAEQPAEKQRLQLWLFNLKEQKPTNMKCIWVSDETEDLTDNLISASRFLEQRT